MRRARTVFGRARLEVDFGKVTIIERLAREELAVEDEVHAAARAVRTPVGEPQGVGDELDGSGGS